MLLRHLGRLNQNRPFLGTGLAFPAYPSLISGNYMRNTPTILALPCMLAASAFAQMTPDQKTTDFLNLAGIYAKGYAPYEWKRDVFHFDLFQIQPWLNQVAASRDDLDFYDVCVRYVASLKSGGHDRFLIPSDFTARLNFTVDIYDGKNADR